VEGVKRCNGGMLKRREVPGSLEVIEARRTHRVRATMPENP
jgi:hypothetical protein